MRNLKKVLSLALAMVMLLGMMVVGAGAATKYEDDDKIVNKEAVTVVSAIGVLQGVGEGKFNPEGTLTRAEAAVVIAKLDLGADAAAALTATNASTFNDVGVGYGWAKAYIDYCAGRGYIVGDGNGNFLPAQTVSSVQFSTMVLRMLGYRDKNEGLTGDNWIINTSALARKSGLTTNVVLSEEGMTRDDMAQMVFNSLTAPTVEYEGMDITIDNVSFNSKAKVRTHTGSSLDGNVSNTTYDNSRIDANITPIRLCEEKFPTLKLSRQDEVDPFGRRCSVWKYKGLKIAGSEVNITPDLAYNTKVTKETVADWAKMEGLYAAKDKNGDITLQLWINGQKMKVKEITPDTTKPNETYAPGTDDWIGWYTGVGREVEVYMNKDNLREVERVVVVDTVLGEVTKANSDGTYSVKLMKTNNKVTTGAVTLIAEADTIVGEVEKGNTVLVQGYGRAVLDKDTTISSVEVAPIMDGFATFKGYSDKEKVSYIKLSGDDTQYKDAYSVVEDFDVQHFTLNTENLDCRLYLDKHGNIMKAVSGKDPNAVKDDLIAVKESYNALNGGKIVTMIKGVISNGETVTWQVTNDKKDIIDNTIYTYEKTNDKITLTILGKSYKNNDDAVANVGINSDINFKANDVFGKLAANKVMYSANVKFIFVGDHGVTVLTGRQTYNLTAGSDKIVAQAFKDGEISAVFINENPNVVDVSELIYVHSPWRENDQVVDVDGKQVLYHGYTAYDAKGEPIEDFLGTTDEMADTFNGTKKTDDGKAYKPDTYNFKVADDKNGNVTVRDHTMTKGVVAQKTDKGDKYGLANNKDAFVLVDAGADKKVDKTYDPATSDDTHYDFLGSKSTKVKDLSTAKLYIESVEEINQAVKDGYYVEVAVIYNATDSDAQYPSSGKVRVPVTVFVTNVSKDPKDVALIPNHEPTEDPGNKPPEGGKLSVASTTTGVNELEFNLIKKGGTVPTTKVAADALTGWVSAINNAEEGDIILVRAKNGGKVTALAATDIFETGTYNQATLGNSNTAPADIGAGTGVYRFTMGKEAVTINKVTTDTPVAEHVFVYAEDSSEKVHIKLASGNTPLSSSTDAEQEKLTRFAVDVINANTSVGDKHGWTATLKYGQKSGKEVVTGFTIAKGNIVKDLTYSNVTNANNLVWATVNGQIVVSATNSATKVSDLCGLVGVTTQKVKVENTSGAIVYNGVASAGSSATVTNGCVITVLDDAKLADLGGEITLPTPNEDGSVSVKPEDTDVPDQKGNVGLDSSGMFDDKTMDYSKVPAETKMTTRKITIPETANKYVWIEQTNSALAMFEGDPSVNDGVKSKGYDFHTDASDVELSFVVINDGKPITFKYVTSTSDITGSKPAAGAGWKTITIDTTGIKFAD